MQINQIIETPEGKYEFNGHLDEDEHSFVIEVGLATLLAQGALPFINKSKVDAGKVTKDIGNG